MDNLWKKKRWNLLSLTKLVNLVVKVIDWTCQWFVLVTNKKVKIVIFFRLKVMIKGCTDNDDDGNDEDENSIFILK